MDQEDHFPINSLSSTNSFDIAIRMNNPSDFTWEDNIVLDSDEKELLLKETLNGPCPERYTILMES